MENFDIFYKVMVRHDLSQDHTKVRNILFQLFSRLHQWSSLRPKIQDYSFDADYDIQMGEVEEEEKKPGLFARFWAWLKSLFSRKQGQQEENEAENK